MTAAFAQDDARLANPKELREYCSIGGRGELVIKADPQGEKPFHHINCSTKKVQKIGCKDIKNVTTPYPVAMHPVFMLRRLRYNRLFQRCHEVQPKLR